MKRRTFLLSAPAVWPALAFSEPTIPVHGLFEHTLRASRESGGPAGGIHARASIEGPDGKHSVELFWDGGAVWKFRFCPEHAGPYRFSIASNDAGLNGQSGAFRATGAAGVTEFDKHGAPRLAPDRHHFVHADGTPWFFLSDTAWNGALLATKDEWDEYLEARAAQRFTAVQFVVTQWRAGRADEDGRMAFSVENGRLNVDPKFFQRMDARVAAIRSHGLVPAPVMLWALTSRDKESPGETLDTRLAIQLAQYINGRYAAYGSLWLLGGDGDYRGEHSQRWKEIGRAVFPAGVDRRPVSLHPRGMQDPWPDLKDEPWLDFLVYQSGHGDSIAKWRWQVEQGLALGWKMTPPRPVLDAEPDYEGHIAYESRKVITDAVVRRAVYSSLFAAPPAGTSYGAHGVWFWARKEVVPLDHTSTGVAKPWRECLAYPGAKQMKVMRDLFDRVPWWTMQPDSRIASGVTPNAEYTNPVQALRSLDGKTALVYLPDNAAVRLDLSGFLSRVEATWMDPRTGGLTPVGPVSAKRGAEFRTPGPGDWILLLRN